MTRFPTPGDYVEALQFPEEAFADPELARGSVEANPLGLPRVITGAYAAVFRVSTPTGDVAVRLFHTDDASRRKRYGEVIRFLESVDWPFVVPMTYQHRGIEVDGERWPLVRMPWIEGQSLGAWLEQHHGDAAAVAAIRQQWVAMVASMEAADFAHGDLQHGNVLVAGDDHRIRLVDFDGAYVPRLKGQPGAEIGHRNYQHPDRGPGDFGPHIDRFSALAVYVALRALEHRPELWPRFSTGENLLFASEDYFDPAGSVLFGELARIGEVADVIGVLRNACLGRLRDVPSLAEAMDGSPGLSMPRGRRTARETEAQRLTGWDRWGRVVALAIVTMSVALALVDPWLGAITLAIGMAAWTVVSAVVYQRQPGVRRRARLLKEAAVLDHWIEDLELDRQGLAEQRRNVAQRSRELVDRRLRELQDQVIRDILKHRFIGELGDDAKVGHRAVIRMKAAGIRTAYHITEARLDAAKGLGPAQRARALAWRQELLAASDGSIPESLSRVELQRLERVVDRQVAEVAAEEVRLQQRIDLQREERARVQAQIDRLPPTGLRNYLAGMLLARGPVHRR